MPSKSPAQARLMAAAHDPAFAKKVGVPQSVGREFNQADKGGPMLAAKRPHFRGGGGADPMMGQAMGMAQNLLNPPKPPGTPPGATGPAPPKEITITQMPRSAEGPPSFACGGPVGHGDTRFMKKD